MRRSQGMLSRSGVVSRLAAEDDEASGEEDLSEEDRPRNASILRRTDLKGREAADGQRGRRIEMEVPGAVEVLEK